MVSRSRSRGTTPVPYFHVVYTISSKLRDIAYQNKRLVYDLLHEAQRPRQRSPSLPILSASVRGSVLPPVPAHVGLGTHPSSARAYDRASSGGPSRSTARDGSPSRSNFPRAMSTVLARLFRGKMLAMLVDAHDAGQLEAFFNTHAGLADKENVQAVHCPAAAHPVGGPLQGVVRSGPMQVLRYLSRYTHRVAISNRRLVAADDTGIAFRWKDYRVNGPGRWKTMRLHPHEFIRRFLLHLLPKGFHRIRHYGLFANTNRAENIATARALFDVTPPAADPQQQPDGTPLMRRTCAALLVLARCGARMIVIEVFARMTASRGGARRRAGSTRHEPGLFLCVAACPFRCAGSTPVAIPLDQSHASVRRWPAVALRACDEMAIALSRPHLLQTGR